MSTTHTVEMVALKPVSYTHLLMIESYIEPGSQKIGQHCYGQSITDPCLGWEDSERLLYEIADNLD